MATDFVLEVVRIMEEAKDSRQAELRIRERFAGNRPYIRGNPPDLGSSRVAASLSTGGTLREAFEYAGVSQATGYRYLSRRWRG